MKLFPTILFLLFVLTVSAQRNNELPIPADSKKALENIEKNKKIRNRSKRRVLKRNIEQKVDITER